jgi:pyruvate dehydrogenase E2 component (dihydrolipoamide acetyltransferase)
MPDITMPRLSDSMVDGTIVSWLHADGDEISIGDEICEVETDKAVMPYQAEYAGTLKIVVREGEAASVGTLIAYIGEPDASNQPQATASATAATPAVAQSASVAARAFSLNGAGSGRVKASPIARRLAASCGVDLALLTGSGPGGRIVKRDIERAGDQLLEASGASGPTLRSVERLPLTPTQATIARRMVEAKQSAPDFTVTVTVDVENAVALRAQMRDAGLETVPTLGDIVIKACALALREHPRINAGYVDGALQLFSQVNVGVAVAAPGTLLVPTIFDPDVRSLESIARETRRLAQRARDGQLTPAEMANATFTISNLGMYRVSHFTAVLNPPQAAILAVGAAEQQVVVQDGQFVARHRMNLTLTADHRVIYGAEAATFLTSVRDRLEHPLKLVI